MHSSSTMAATALRLMRFLLPMTQGSSFLATLGFEPESLWDSRSARSALQQFPNTQCFSRAPGLRIATALSMRRVAIEHFGDLADATFGQQTVHAAQISTRGGDGFGRVVPGTSERFAKNREGPGPRGAVVIRGLAARVFVAFIAAPVRFFGIVEQTTVVAMNRQRHRNGQRREGSQRAGHNQTSEGRCHRTFR